MQANVVQDETQEQSLPCVVENNNVVRAGWAEKFDRAIAETNEDDSADFADWNEIKLSNFDEQKW